MPWEASLSPQASCSSLTCWHWASPWGHTSLSFPTMCTDIVSNKSNTFHSTPTCCAVVCNHWRRVQFHHEAVMCSHLRSQYRCWREGRRKESRPSMNDGRMNGWVAEIGLIEDPSFSPVCEQHNANYVSFPLLCLFGLSPSGLSRKCELLELLHTQGRRNMFKTECANHSEAQNVCTHNFHFLYLRLKERVWICAPLETRFHRPPWYCTGHTCPISFTMCRCRLKQWTTYADDDGFWLTPNHPTNQPIPPQPPAPWSYTKKHITNKFS